MNTSSKSQMHQEIMEIPSVIEQLLTHGAKGLQEAARAISNLDPGFFISVARGSSDHVATYFKYAGELLLGIPTASVGPSVASIYGSELRLKNSVCLSVSQSGKSPDIVEMTRMAKAGGALTIALTNNPNSDLAHKSNHTLALHAGDELSVAATKTFIASAVSAVWLLAALKEDRELLDAIHVLPRILSDAVTADWGALSGHLADSLFCLGRGPAYAISNEAALKFKETCQLHAESYSSAEVLHGPVSIVDQGFPILAFAARDQAESAVVDVADALAQKGASVFITSDQAKHATPLPTARTAHPLTDPIALIASFYAMVEPLSRARGIDPDKPRHLKKVTETV